MNHICGQYQHEVKSPMAVEEAMFTSRRPCSKVSVIAAIRAYAWKTCEKSAAWPWSVS